jgi:hypothetical protein
VRLEVGQIAADRDRRRPGQLGELTDPDVPAVAHRLNDQFLPY